MTASIITRDSIDKDIPALAHLTIELGYPTTATEMQDRMRIILQNNDYKTVVAVKGEKVLGYIGMFKCNYWECNGCFIRIQTLVVGKEARRMGVGELLIEAADNWGKEIGALMLSLNCGHKDEREGAHKFYPSIGFSATAVGYTRTIKKA